MYLTQGLRRAQQIRPKATSTVFRGRRRTWSETAERVARFAGGLKAAGIRPGDRVAILALNSDLYCALGRIPRHLAAALRRRQGPQARIARAVLEGLRETDQLKPASREPAEPRSDAHHGNGGSREDMDNPQSPRVQRR
jgi:non-ribosomal peptide synthetase component F